MDGEPSGRLGWVRGAMRWCPTQLVDEAVPDEPLDEEPDAEGAGAGVDDELLDPEDSEPDEPDDDPASEDVDVLLDELDPDELLDDPRLSVL